MAYEVFKRNRARVEQPTVSIVPGSKIAINAAAARLLLRFGIKFVLLLWDRTNNKIAIKAAKKGDENTYTVSIIREGTSGSVRAKSFLSYLGWSAQERKMLPAVWNEEEKMFEVALPPEYLGSEKLEMKRRKTVRI